MSSAILYLAIVAIWACVLIPRWLRRDSAHGVVNATAHAVAPDGFADPVAPDEIADDADLDDAELASETLILSARPDGLPPPPPPPLPAAAPLDAEESRRRMLTARRRLLGMLVLLEAAAIALAVIGLAALWVVAPPTLMLIGYLLLLREAAQADAEHGQREAEAAATAAARVRERERARIRREADRRIAERATPVEGVPLAARFAAAPVAADYEDSGRDFAPGLAGKYTPSNADSERGEFADDEYDYQAHPLRRAVGD